MDSKELQTVADASTAGLPGITLERRVGPDWEVYRVGGKAFLLMTEMPSVASGNVRPPGSTALGELGEAGEHGVAVVGLVAVEAACQAVPDHLDVPTGDLERAATVAVSAVNDEGEGNDPVVADADLADLCP